MSTVRSAGMEYYAVVDKNNWLKIMLDETEFFRDIWEEGRLSRGNMFKRRKERPSEKEGTSY